jgi:hypothetical protein
VENATGFSTYSVISKMVRLKAKLPMMKRSSRIGGIGAKSTTRMRINPPTRKRSWLRPRSLLSTFGVRGS